MRSSSGLFGCGLAGKTQTFSALPFLYSPGEMERARAVQAFLPVLSFFRLALTLRVLTDRFPQKKK